MERTLKDGRILVKTLEDGRAVTLAQMPFDNWHLCLSESEDAPGHLDGWWYGTKYIALLAAHLWDPTQTKEPEGWYRNPKSRRWRPDGDATQEYVQCLGEMK